MYYINAIRLYDYEKVRLRIHKKHEIFELECLSEKPKGPRLKCIEYKGELYVVNDVAIENMDKIWK